MSKRKSAVSSNNTLFNYFAKTPPSSKSAKLSGGSESPKVDSVLNGDKKDSKNESKKHERQASPPAKMALQSDSEDDAPIVTKKRKRIRLHPAYDDSDSENKKVKVDNKVDTSQEKLSVEKILHESFKYESSNSPKLNKTPAIPTTSVAPVKSQPESQTAKTPESQETSSLDEGNWIHCKLEWLKPHKIRDAQKRRPGDPDYDPTTLFVPPDFLNNQTPAHRQWWELKSSHYDCVLFFKVGKFYELYHMDASVGVNELGFSYMKGEFAHSGFPESAYARMANTLVSKGYKVARVEQTETPDMMKERCTKLRQTSKFDKVVRREICQVTLRGAQACGLQDPGPGEPEASYMMAIAEESGVGRVSFGVCFVDASIGRFRIGQFRDDKHCSRLLTTLAHFPPALVVYDRKTTSAQTSRLLATHCAGARREAVALWPPEKTLKLLAEKYYRTDADGSWPEGLKEFLHEGDALGLTPAAECYLAVKALGGCVSYLTSCLLDIQVLSMSQFEAYSPPDVLGDSLSQKSQQWAQKAHKWEGGSTMVLDAITLRNLRIVQEKGCLYDKLNFCSTNMGKRLLYQWVCAPSCSLNVIAERQEAVKALLEDVGLCQSAKALLKPLPDLERLLAKVHTLGNLHRSTEHPDSRAIFYEEKIYTKRKILDFLSVLNGFAAALALVDLFATADAVLLKRLMQFSPDGQFPDYRDTLEFFKNAFDHKEAEKEGRILPGKGVDQEYDRTLRRAEEIKQELEEYRKRQEEVFRCRVSYVGSDKKRYQLEVPEKNAARAGPDYQMEGARKGFKRFSTTTTKNLLESMIEVEEQRTNVLKDLSRRMFEKFSSHRSQWEAGVRCVATLDVLLSLAEFARAQSGDVCLPAVTYNADEQPYIKITEGRHPCIPVVDAFIPNDTQLGVRGGAAGGAGGGAGGTLLLLTGPNMGGKSTLMRQVALITVLAHMGSYVPAAECSVSVVDRVFTRLGAHDDILAGQSTFLVEMQETTAIVKHASVHSLVLLDELGRGTSTYDGTAIASGVCAELAARGCRVIFSTHYHALVNHLASHPGVVLGHMACMVETDESAVENEEEIPEETITFLYKLSPGACPKSYGFNAARLAGIPREITRRARQVCKQLEKEAVCVRTFRDVLKMEDNMADVRNLLAAFSI